MKINTFLDLCSGIGGGRLGLEQAGLKCVGFSDTSKLAKRTYELMHDTTDEKYYYNLKRIKCETLPDYDLLIAGFPCQTFSVIGRKDGFSDDRGQIIFHLARILEESQPKCFLFENVKGLVTHDKGKTINIIINELNRVGYDVVYKVLTSLDYGVPQMRQRVYFIGIRKDLGYDISSFNWPKTVDKPGLESYLIDNNVASEERLEILKYYLNNPTNQGKYTVDDIRSMEGKIIDTRMNDLRIYDGKCPTLRAQRDGVLYVRNHVIYQLTGYEALLLQGFPKDYADKVKDEVSDRHLLMQAGNAMTVNVIESLGRSIIDFFSTNYSLNQNKPPQTGTISMKPGVEFEKDCYKYLMSTYKKYRASFELRGNMNSTVSDILVSKEGCPDFYIEVKDTKSQSGQFVVINDHINERFYFSPRNRSQENHYTTAIIEKLNSNYDTYKNVDTASIPIDVDFDIIGNWIIGHYKNKKVEFVITKGKDYIIFPLDRYKAYFKLSANIRLKPSGSSVIPKKQVSNINGYLLKTYNITQTFFTAFDDNKQHLCFYSKSPIPSDVFILGRTRYQCSHQHDQLYEVRKLTSNLKPNPSVIFSVLVKQPQNNDDLKAFIDRIK